MLCAHMQPSLYGALPHCFAANHFYTSGYVLLFEETQAACI